MERFSLACGGGPYDRVKESVTLDGVGEVRGDSRSVDEVVPNRGVGVHQRVDHCSGQAGIVVVAAGQRDLRRPTAAACATHRDRTDVRELGGGNLESPLRAVDDQREPCT